MNPIPSNRHELFPFLSIRHARSRFARDLENMVDLGLESELKMLPIRFPCCRFDVPEVFLCETICAPLDNVGWVTYESTEVCGHVLRTRKVHASLFHGSLLPTD